MTPAAVPASTMGARSRFPPHLKGEGFVLDPIGRHAERASRRPRGRGEAGWVADVDIALIEVRTQPQPREIGERNLAALTDELVQPTATAPSTAQAHP